MHVLSLVLMIVLSSVPHANLFAVSLHIYFVTSQHLHSSSYIKHGISYINFCMNTWFIR